jgi:hypothetical protein
MKKKYQFHFTRTISLSLKKILALMVEGEILGNFGKEY